jgi:hypothetical protein
LRVKEEVERLGRFWLPSAPDRKITGTLSISDGGNIGLELTGVFEENEIEALEKYNLKRIVGQIEQDGYITLEDCSYRATVWPFGGGVSKASVSARTIFIGVGYDEADDPVFNTLAFSVEGIDEWVGLSGIKVDYQHERPSATISYQPPEEILLNLNNDMRLLITFPWCLPSSQNAWEAKITQKTYFKLISTVEKKLDDFTAVAHNLTTFLCFAVDETVCLNSLTATSDNLRFNINDTETAPAQIGIYYQSLPYSKDEPKIDPRQMLFRFGQIRNHVERIINNWIKAYDQIDSALNLYFSTKTGAQQYLDRKFSALAQGLETLHRRTSDEKMMDESKFKELVGIIVDQCPEEHRAWLEGRLQHGNEISLARRLKSITEPFKADIGTSRQRCKLITNIVGVRNYLTHFDESLKEKMVHGRNLLVLYLKMEAIFQLNLLQVLGFTPQEIKSILKNSYKLKQKLSES